MAAAKTRTYTTQVLASDDIELARIAGMSRGDVRYYVGTIDGGEIFRVSRSAARQWDKLFVEVDPDGTLHCDCGRSRCCHRGAVKAWMAHREALCAGAVAA